ncbi:MAG: PilC/PilY family type IV pilus protein [Pseudomonadota bacterium]
MKFSKLLTYSCAGALMATLGATSAFAQASPGVIAQSPLFLSDSVEPNVIMAIDDSGSMDWEILLPTRDGLPWWDRTNETFLNNDGSFRFNGGQRYAYIFPNGFDAANQAGSTMTFNGTFWPLPPVPEHAFAKSASYNRAYYNHTLDYEPWVSTGLRTFADSNPTAAPWDPVADAATFTIDLTQTVARETIDITRMFVVFEGMRFFDGTVNTGPNGIYDGWDYYPATYFVPTDVGTGFVGDIFTGTFTPFDCASPDPAVYRVYRENSALFIALGGDADTIGPDGRCLTRVEIRNDGRTFPSGRSYAEEIQNFANWFTYYRKRHQAMRGGVSQAFSEITGVRAGRFLFNNRQNVDMVSLTTDGDAFLDEIFTARGTGGTPTRQVIDYMGRQFERSDASRPIIEACQKNFGILFTDGFANTNAITVGNTDGGEGIPYADAFENTIADAAMEYYLNLDAPAGLTPGLVPTPAACAGTPNPLLDCNADLHMVTYGVTLNTVGEVFGVTHFTRQDAFDNPPTWLEPSTSFTRTQVDDIYHATINGRGELLNASSPTEIATQMQDVLAAVLETEGTAAAVTFNTGLLSSDSLVYQAKLDSEEWSGFLTASALDPITGDVNGTASWDAADLIPAASARQIVTYDPANGGIPFNKLPALTAEQQDDLNTDLPTGFTGQDILDYLRGDRSNESETGLRERSTRTVLGDIVHSGPVLVGRPISNWPDAAPFPTGTDAYSTFESGPAASRREAVYVGANDGMLHGIWADTGSADSGAEFMGFVPNALFSNVSGEGLHALAQQSYVHRYFVDLTPVVTDAYVPTVDGFGPDWHTILVGGLRNGGAGYFALDVTDPTAMTEANAADFVMWEFTSDDDPDLGAAFSEPTIALMANGRWAAIFGNGYNNPGSGQAALFIVFLDGGLDRVWTLGSDYIKITLPGANNGLSSPQLADLDNDRVPDRIYAGDLQGNMWAFDVSNANTSQWRSDYRGGATPEPLFTATDASNNPQPITSRPVLARCPYDNSVSPDIMVLFGTGQYITEGDKSSTDQQTFYGIWDRGVEELDRDDLLEQFANDPALTYDTTAVRIPSNLAMDPATEFGWHMDFPDTGERTVSNPLVRGSALFFNTIVPSATDPCVIGGGGWLMSVDICDGSRPEIPLFDLNGDELITNGDVVADNNLTDADGNPLTFAPGGEKFNPNEGLPWQSSILGDRQYTPGSTGSIEKRAIDVTNNTLDGRLSWEQLINE